MDNKELSVIDGNNEIKNYIYLIRNQQVMLDSDLAMLYQVKTMALNQAVKRNISRFPERYRFQLTKEECKCLISQSVISKDGDSKSGRGGRRNLPYAFTEQGIAMLSSVLRSEIAISVNMRIMDSFVEMRRYMANTSLLHERLNAMEVRQINYQNLTDERFEKVFDYISTHEESEQRVFFDGQIYDAFSLMSNLIQKADFSLLLIDNYVDVKTLNLLAKKKNNVAVTIYTLNNGMLSNFDVSAFNAQYPTVSVKYTNKFHDRFLLVDGKYGYHIGASLKDAGKKCFAINIIQDISIILSIL